MPFASLGRVRPEKRHRLPGRAHPAATAARHAPGTDVTPGVRAAADRFIYEQATLKHLVALVPVGGLRRHVAGSGRTVGSLFVHLAASLTRFADSLRNTGDGDALPEPACQQEGPETASEFSALDIVRLFGSGLVDLLSVLQSLPDEIQPVGERHFAEVLEEWSGHFLSHAIQLLDAVPEARLDALILNWLLDAAFESEHDREWQQALLAEAQAYVASLPDDVDDDDE